MVDQFFFSGPSLHVNVKIALDPNGEDGRYHDEEEGEVLQVILSALGEIVDISKLVGVSVRQCCRR